MTDTLTIRLLDREVETDRCGIPKLHADARHLGQLVMSGFAGGDIVLERTKDLDYCTEWRNGPIRIGVMTLHWWHGYFELSGVKLYVDRVDTAEEVMVELERQRRELKEWLR